MSGLLRFAYILEMKNISAVLDPITACADRNLRKKIDQILKKIIWYFICRKNRTDSIFAVHSNHLSSYRQRAVTTFCGFYFLFTHLTYITASFFLREITTSYIDLFFLWRILTRD
jgi:hypothetical protein